eukprot:2563-Eustigmatos_ZCMA.PRE.1
MALYYVAPAAHYGHIRGQFGRASHAVSMPRSHVIEWNAALQDAMLSKMGSWGDCLNLRSEGQQVTSSSDD